MFLPSLKCQRGCDRAIVCIPIEDDDHMTSPPLEGRPAGDRPRSSFCNLRTTRPGVNTYGPRL